MSLKRNILASYATQIYVTLIGILIFPMYLKYMGAEAYGLVGFFTMLQAWFNLLDMGLTPTVARETARFRGGAIDAVTYRRLLRGLQLIFLAIALFGGGTMFAFSGLIADRWLNAQTLPLSEIRTALHLIAAGVALRWMSGLYRGCISGTEQLVWLGGFNAIAASLRFLGILPILIWIENSPAMFFAYQLLISALELAFLASKAHKTFPVLPVGQLSGTSTISLLVSIRPLLKYSLTIAFTSSVWVLVTQIDKLVLSGMLSLTDYGYFTLAVLLASGIMNLCAPVTNPLTLRMVKLYAEGKKEHAFLLYETATSLITVFAGSIALSMSLFSYQILMAWTSDKNVATEGGLILSLYSLGYFFCALSAFPGYIQQARGDLKYHFLGNLLLLALMVPAISISAYFWHARGAAVVWVSINFLYLAFWTWFTHEKLIPSIHGKWLINCVLKIILPGVFVGVMFKTFYDISESRIISIIELFFIWLVIFISMISFVEFIRKTFIKRIIGGLQ